MWTRIIVVIILLAAEAGLGYYSLVISGSLLSKFLFFLFSSAIICILILRGIHYILPDESPSKTDAFLDGKKKDG